jgi:hypothetical protein
MPSPPRFDGPCANRKSLSGKCGSQAPTRLLIYCQDYRCAHSVTVDAQPVAG